jgi:Predicted polymerase, most proteins contain PALM domain, HD hydrolase domain and Zn-ribbon domain
MSEEKMIIPARGQQNRDGYCKIMCSIDLMEAYLVIEKPLGDGKWPTIEDAVAAIQMQNLKYGLIKEALINCIDRRKTTEVLIAKGKPPVAGNDTQLKSYFELNDLKKVYLDSLVQDEHGRIDYRNVKSIEVVRDGQIVGEKILPTEGEDGINVLGNTVKAEPGKERPIKLGKNTRWDQEELRIIATGDGKATMINNSINVLPIHEIKGDVDFKTGNIDFPGNIIIHGNVTNGFTVTAEGEVVIIGDVDASDITASGRISIGGSFQGMDKATLSSGGDINVKMINRGIVNAKGSLLVKETIMHSQVSAAKKVIVEGGKGWIVGGKICAGESISAKVVGSKLGAATELEVGITVRPSLETSVIQYNLQDQESEVQETQEGYTYLLNLEEAPKNANLDKSRVVKVKETIYPGVKVSITAASCMIRDENSFVILYYSYEGKIVAQSYR